MAHVQDFMNFLKSRSTGLKQKSADWVRARQKTIGASEVAALVGSSPFENPKSLLQKKRKSEFLTNAACTWRSLFEPLVRRYFEQKHSVSVFGHSIFLNLERWHPLYQKVTCSLDGYFLYKDNELVLLEFKCPFKRKIAMKCIPEQYKDQIQTFLAFSGEKVNKGLFVDAYFRMCSLKQPEPSLKHNPHINGVGHIPQKTLQFLRGAFAIYSASKKYPPIKPRLQILGQ